MNCINAYTVDLCDREYGDSCNILAVLPEDDAFSYAYYWNLAHGWSGDDTIDLCSINGIDAKVNPDQFFYAECFEINHTYEVYDRGNGYIVFGIDLIGEGIHYYYVVVSDNYKADVVPARDEDEDAIDWLYTTELKMIGLYLAKKEGFFN